MAGLSRPSTPGRFAQTRKMFAAAPRGWPGQARPRRGVQKFRNIMFPEICNRDRLDFGNPTSANSSPSGRPESSKNAISKLFRPQSFGIPQNAQIKVFENLEVKIFCP
jgi:hypothetical protein